MGTQLQSKLANILHTHVLMKKLCVFGPECCHNSQHHDVKAHVPAIACKPLPYHSMLLLDFLIILAGMHIDVLGVLELKHNKLPVPKLRRFSRA